MNYFSDLVKVDLSPVTTDGGGVMPDFSFFTSEKAKNIANGDGSVSEDKPAAKKRTRKSSAEDVPAEVLSGSGSNSADISETDYAKSYAETTGLIRGTIMMTDEIDSEISQDLRDVRSSKTLKNKYGYITDLTASRSSVLNTKISAIKELNATITQIHKLNVDRAKALKLDAAQENDDMRMMDLYSAFVNTPQGSYTPPSLSVQDLTLGVNSPVGNVSAVEMVAQMNGNGLLTPEQNRMRMEANPNIQTIVRFDPATGGRAFDVIDKTNGASIPNYPRPDNFLLEDTTIDISNRIARNRNINAVWPLVIEGNMNITEY